MNHRHPLRSTALAPRRTWVRLAWPLLLALGAIAALLAGLSAAGARPASAGEPPLLFTVSSRDQLLRVIDPNLGFTVAGVMIHMPGKVIETVNGLAAHPNTGQLYALLKFQGQQSRVLVTLNSQTGLATAIGDTGLSLATLAFSADGTLYAVTGEQGPNPETLYTLNLATGAPALVIALGNGSDGEALAYSSFDGFMYHFSGRSQLNEPTGKIFERINLGAVTVQPITLTGAVGFVQEVAAFVHAGGDDFYVAKFREFYGWSKVTRFGELITHTLLPMDHIAKGLAWSRSAPPQAPTCRLGAFGVANNDDLRPSLYSIDPNSGETHLLGPLSDYHRAFGLERAPDGRLYVAAMNYLGNHRLLLSVDPCTGHVTEVGHIGAPGGAYNGTSSALALHPNGSLAVLDASGRQLLFFDPAVTTTASLTTAIPFAGNLHGLDYGPDGTLYLGRDDQLLTIDPTTGLTLTQVSLTFPGPMTGTVFVRGLDYDSDSGHLLAALRQETQVWSDPTWVGRINPANGQVTIMGQTVSWLDSLALDAGWKLYLPLVSR